MSSTDSVVIVNGARTPMGGLNGCFAPLTGVELGTVATKAAMERSGVAPDEVDEIYMGCVIEAGMKQAPARQVGIHAGLSEGTGAVTINKVCGSGMQAMIFAHDQIRAGSIDVAVAGGLESMSNAPHILEGSRRGVGTGHRTLMDTMFCDGLEDAYTGSAMGAFAQKTADHYGITREEMDAYAIQSLDKALTAIENKSNDDEIVPVRVQTRKLDYVVNVDEQPGKANAEKIPTLRPVFAKDGTITAANASSISDGASAVVMMSEAEAEKRGLQPMARIVAHARHSREPEEYTQAPVGAMQKLFEKTGWTPDSTDLFEINEAFAMVPMMAIDQLGLDEAKVNVHGGACSQGHPLGSTASRLVVTLMYALRHCGKKRGIAAMCIGGGEGLAMAIEAI